MAFDLRDYQRSLVQRAVNVIANDGVPCVVCPTGGGKTVILSELARQALAAGHRVVVVAHRQEIIGQITGSLERHIAGARIETVTAGSRARWRSPITVGMVPTLARRLGQLQGLQGCVLLQDECHHAASRSWLNVTAALRPRARAGLTATPVRPDGRGLGDTAGFSELLIGPHPDELMAMGALCRYRLFAAPRQVSTQGLRKRAGEFIQSEVETRVIAINGQIVPDWLEFNPGRLPTITVAVSVEHAHQVAELYRAAGIAAEAVDGETPKAQRQAIFDRFRKGTTTVLVACAVIDEGLDVPEATVLQVLRPTASLRLWKQLCGRVLRPAPGKDHAVLIDHTDNWRRLPLPDARIDWQLNPDVQPAVERRKLEVDAETNEVRVGPAVEIESSGQRLLEITPELIAKAHPTTARRMFNQRFQQELTAVLCGDEGAESMRGWLKRIPVLEQQNLAALGEVLGMGPGWAAAQGMLNGMLPGARLAATKAAQQAMLV